MYPVNRQSQTVIIFILFLFHHKMSPIFQNSYYNGWGYQQPYYPAVPNQDIDDKNSTTAEPEPEVVRFFQDFNKRLLI